MNRKQKTQKKQKTIVWILLGMWMLVIFIFSAQNAEDSSDLSEGFLRRFVLWFLPEEVCKDKDIVDFLEYLVRKCAHMAEFAVLGILISVQLYLYDLCQKSSKRIALAVLFVMLYATTDEIHQLFVGGRSGRVTDVLIDTTGGFIGVTAFCIWKKLTNKKSVEDKQ